MGSFYKGILTYWVDYFLESNLILGIDGYKYVSFKFVFIEIPVINLM